MVKRILCPSLMCADYGHLSLEIEELEDAGADCFHIDVMDGHYVENFGMGMQDIEFVSKKASIPFEVHLMVMNPHLHLEKFTRLGARIIYIHPETSLHPAHVLEKILALGAKPGIVLSPETSIETVNQLLFLSDYVMAMTVNPGFSGNKYLPYVEEKIKALCALRDRFGFEIEVDGGCTRENIKCLSEEGVSRFVLGTKGLFAVGKTYKQSMEYLHNM